MTLPDSDPLKGKPRLHCSPSTSASEAVLLCVHPAGRGLLAHFLVLSLHKCACVCVCEKDAVGSVDNLSTPFRGLGEAGATEQSA